MHIKTPPDKLHITQVDYIRAFASLSVAIFHMGGKTLPVLNYGWLGVEMFFFLSGFIICWAIPLNYSLKLAPMFIFKRIARIEPPYIISIFLVLAVRFLLDTNYKPDLKNVAFHFAYINSFLKQPYLNPVYWTLAIEFQYYIFIAWFFPLILKKWGPAALVIICILPGWINISGDSLINVFPLFALGIIYFLYKRNSITITSALFYGSSVTVIGIWRLGFLPTSAALFALLTLLLPLPSNRIVSFFAKISFSLYLTHDIVGSNYVVYIGSQLPKTIAFKGVEFSSGIAISILFAWIFYKLVELPSLKLSKRIRYALLAK